jgi:hypothetical protein
MVAVVGTQDKRLLPSVEQGIRAATAHLSVMQEAVIQAAREGKPAHEVERDLFRQVLELGGKLFGGFLQLVGPGDLGETVTLADGREVQRLPAPHARRLLTVFGEFSLSRWVYGTRAGQKLELIPTDQRLQLPESELSYLLQDWDQLLGIEHAFGGVRETMATILRLRQSVNTLEHTNQRMAEAAPAFRAAQPAPDPKAEGELLVVTEDNKGVPMVRPADALPAGAHRKKGEKANKKQMACLGCVYTVDPNVRTPAELLATLFRDADRPQRQPPKAQQKRYWAELSRVIAGEAVCGQDLVFQHLRAEIAQRRRPGQVLVNLCDGQRSLETDRAEYLPADARTVDILDLMHVAPRLWAVAHLFHAEGSDAAERFVRERLLRVLHGELAGVLKGLRRMGTQQKLAGAKRKRLRGICAFLERNRYRMRYDEYLRQGYPIASGVIEGACRHVVRDRMERAGMRWKLPGAQAMLHLRVIHTNGDWTAFQEFRIAQETQRLYPQRQHLADAAWPMLDLAV